MSNEHEDEKAGVVRTFLIADVRGYTSFTQQHGDEQAGTLATRFAALTRETVLAGGGEMIELRGDEALCVFRSTRQALRVAIDLQIRFRRSGDGEPVFPLGIGIGLDAGEAVRVEDGYRGGALNVAARLCSIAGPGQILTTETVAAIARKVDGARFVPRRAARLKGLEKPVRVIEVAPEAELPPLPLTPGPKRRLRALLAAAAAAVVLAGALSAALLTLTGSSRGPAMVGNAIASVADSGDVSYTHAGTTPSTIAAGEHAVWVLNADDRTISKLDPATGPVKTFGTGGTTTDLAVGEGAVWIGNGSRQNGIALANVSTSSISRIDPASTEVTKTITLTPQGNAGVDSGSSRVLGVSQLAVGAGAVWAINPDRTVSKIDPDTGHVERIDVTAGSAIAGGKKEVWVVAGDVSQLIRIDARTKRVRERIDIPADSLTGLAVGGGAAWTTDLGTGILWRLDPGEPPRPIDVGFGATGVAYGGGSVWVTNFVSDQLVRVDARTNKIAGRIPIAGTASSVAASGKKAWVSVAGAPSGDVLPASICGPVRAAVADPDILIASDLPLQGSSGELTRPLVAAIARVLKAHRFRAGPHTVGYQSCDDSTAQTGGFDILKCASNAKAYAATPRLVGVIGPYTSPCAWAQIPIANRAEGPLAMISPSNTHPGLTHRAPGGDPDEPDVYYPTGTRNYVRVTGAADFDGAAGAVLAHQLALPRMYVLRSLGGSEETTAPFRRAAKRLGITIAGSATWDPKATSYTRLARGVAAARPDGVYIGDVLPANGAAVVKTLRARLGSKVVLIAGDGFQPVAEVLREAGEAAIGMYVTTTAVAHEGLSNTGRRLLRGLPSATYAAEAAQAAEALLAAIARSDGTRGSVTRELLRLQLRNGILGSFRFDRNGDITPATFTVFRIDGRPKADPDLPDYFSGGVVDRIVRVPERLVRP